MKAVGRVGIWTAVLLLVLAAMSWAGFVSASPDYFIVSAAALVILIGFLAIVVGSLKKQFRDVGPGQAVSVQPERRGAG
jgi:hypothetical protein